MVAVVIAPEYLVLSGVMIVVRSNKLTYFFCFLQRSFAELANYCK